MGAGGGHGQQEKERAGENGERKRSGIVQRRPAGRELRERSRMDGRTDGKSPGRETHRSAGLELPGTGWKEEAEKRGWRRRVEEEEREGGQVGAGGARAG